MYNQSVEISNIHTAGILSCKFCNTLTDDCYLFASAGLDRNLNFYLYNTSNNNIQPIASIPYIHKNAILNLEFSNNTNNIEYEHLFTASADYKVSMFDLSNTHFGTRIKSFRNASFVNAISTFHSVNNNNSNNLILAACDNGYLNIFDIRVKGKTPQIQMEFNYPLTCVSALSNNSIDMFYTGSIDNRIYCFDLRNISNSNIDNLEPLYTLSDHTDTITGISISHSGEYLLSNSVDNSLHIYDIKPYCDNRLAKVLVGHLQTIDNYDYNSNLLLRCSWSADDKYVSCGSTDKMVNIWSANTGKLVFSLPGHVSVVTETDFHPTEPIIISCGIDRKIFIGNFM